MSFRIVRNDITEMKVDAIVNSANHKVAIGVGIDSRIYKKAGEKLLDARKEIGEISFGDAAITPGFDTNAKYIIHAVSPVWENGKSNEKELLADCYRKSMLLALNNECKSIAFPILAAGNNGFPPEIALQTAISEISKFLMNNDILVYLVVFDENIFKLASKLFDDVDKYIDEHYVDEILYEESNFTSQNTLCRPSRATSFIGNISSYIDDNFKVKEETFSESLLNLISEKGLTDPEFYRRANIDRKLFSKLRNKDYHPSKKVAISCAIALELDLQETLDLLGKAGYTLSSSILFDVIIEYYISNRKYNIVEINSCLDSKTATCLYK